MPWFLGGYSKALRPSTLVGSGTASDIEACFGTALPTDSTEYAIVCVPERYSSVPLKESDADYTRVYLIRRYSDTPIVEAVYEMDELYFGRFMPLSDGSVLLVGHNGFVRRVRRVGSTLVFGPRHDFSTTELENPWLRILPYGDGFYVIEGRVYYSIPGISGHEQAWAQRYSYNLSTDQVTLETDWHKFFDVVDWDNPSETTAYRIDPVTGIGGDPGDGYLIWPWAEDWRRGSTARRTLRLAVVQPQPNGQLVMVDPWPSLTLPYLSKVLGAVYNSYVGWDVDTNQGYAYGWEFSPTAATSTNTNVWKSDGNGGVVVGSGARGEAGGVNEGVDSMRWSVNGPSFALNGFGHIWLNANGYRLSRYCVNADTLDLTELTGDEVDLSDDIPVDMRWNEGTEYEAKFSMFTLCRMGPRITLVTFVDNSGDAKWRYFRILYENSLLIPPLLIPRKEWAHERGERLRQHLQAEGVDPAVAIKWADTLVKWSNERSNADYANYRQIEDWVEGMRDPAPDPCDEV